MQRERTIDFWNRHHHEDDNEVTDGDGQVPNKNKEWILTPSDVRLLNLLHTYLGQMNLELGCGTSQLSARLHDQRRDRTFVVTDASPVCLQQNRIRDAAYLSERFQYHILNAVQVQQPLEKDKDSTALDDDTIVANTLEARVSCFPILPLSFDAVLDKGCLDTFLFRSSIRIREKLVDQLLTNVHGWLVEGGRYLVMSPRSKIAKLRDYPGFSSVKRILLNHTNATLGALEDGKKSSSISKQATTTDPQDHSQAAAVYLYVCTKGLRVVSDLTQPPLFSCPACHVKYVAFLDKQKIPERKKERRWKNHISHCH